MPGIVTVTSLSSKDDRNKIQTVNQYLTLPTSTKRVLRGRIPPQTPRLNTRSGFYLSHNSKTQPQKIVRAFGDPIKGVNHS